MQSGVSVFVVYADFDGSSYACILSLKHPTKYIQYGLSSPSFFAAARSCQSEWVSQDKLTAPHTLLLQKRQAFSGSPGRFPATCWIDILSTVWWVATCCSQNLSNQAGCRSPVHVCHKSPCSKPLLQSLVNLKQLGTNR